MPVVKSWSAIYHLFESETFHCVPQEERRYGLQFKSYRGSHAILQQKISECNVQDTIHGEVWKEIGK